MRVSTSINRIVLAGWILFYIGLLFVDLTFISPNIEVDSELLMEFSYVKTVFNTEGSYFGTARIFRLIPENLLQPLVLIIGVISLVVFLKDFRKISTIAIGLYTTLPPLLLFLTWPSKETIVLVMTIAVLFTFKSKMPEWLKIAIFAVTYCAYALFVRKYYFLILLAFLGFYVIKKSPGMLNISLVLFAGGVLALLPGDVFLKTQGMRDVVNYSVGVTRIIRTAFLNPYPADDAWHFLINYVYAAFRLHLPIFFTFSYKEILHIISVGIFLRFIPIGWKAKGDDASRLCSLLILAHILILIIFEPDLGSYLRHLTSIFLYMKPMMLLYDAGQYNKIQLKQ